MNYEDIKKLINDMGDSKIDSLDIEFPEGIKISMKKNQTIVKEITTPKDNIPNVIVTQKQNMTQDIPEKTEAEEDYKVVKSPMVGTFYSSNSPKEEDFVKVGDKVKKGQVLCIVEAMKLMNEIESEFDGEIIEACVKNEDMVEYGTPLFKIK
ncbi:MAG: acetyl-CoA carboxylase biotin carboxyl carrier protein [Clostridia bacterium]